MHPSAGYADSRMRGAPGIGIAPFGGNHRDALPVLPATPAGTMANEAE
jgi:hypothetical protein